MNSTNRTGGSIIMKLFWIENTFYFPGLGDSPTVRSLEMQNLL